MYSMSDKRLIEYDLIGGSGSRKSMKQSVAVRPDIHVLVVGDPGLGTYFLIYIFCLYLWFIYEYASILYLHLHLHTYAIGTWTF